MTTVEIHRAEPLLELGCVLGEGPIQLRDGTLCWVDILDGIVYRWDRRGEPSSLRFDEPVGAVAEAVDGGLVAATMSGLVLVTQDDRRRDLAALPGADPGVRMNDGKPDPAGRFIGGTMGYPSPRPGVGSLWSFGQGEPVELVANVTISNGLAWSADGETMFYIDSPTHRVDAFDYDVATGRVSNRRTVVEIPAGPGGPDGMCIDREGGLWVAMWGGSAVHRYLDGNLTSVVEVPTPYVTCPVFAGPNLDELVITTATEPFGDVAPPGAGDLYAVTVGVPGCSSATVDIGRLGTSPPGE